MRTDARALRSLVAACALALAGAAAAHATLVFGTVTTEPAPPLAGEPVTVFLELRDPVDAAIEDALVHIEAVLPGADHLITSDQLQETEPGSYRTELVLPDPGAWTLTFRDRTFRQEEARASITLDVGPDAPATPSSFIFPPTATGPQSLSTWLIWLIGLPLVAGAVVTVMVLRGGSDGDEGDDADDPRETGEG